MLSTVLILENSHEKRQYPRFQGDYKLMGKQKTTTTRTAQMISECDKFYEGNCHRNIILKAGWGEWVILDRMFRTDFPGGVTLIFKLKTLKDQSETAM